MTAECGQDDLAEYAVRDVEGLSLGDQKGAGSFGAVYKVTVKGVPRIAKKLHNILLRPCNDANCSDDGEAILRKFRNECHLLSKLDHPNIVEFVGVHFGVDSNDLSLLMENLHTDLEQFLTRKRPHICSIPISVKFSMLNDVLSGLSYLHCQTPAIIHRDLTASNVLLTRDLRAKIADLGVSKLLNLHPNEMARQTSCPGALAYMSPEALRENPVYGKELDIFSFGQLSLFVAVQEFPIVYDVTDDPDMAAALQNDHVQILKRQKWFKKLQLLPSHESLSELAKQCLHDKPHQRPTIKILHGHLKTLSVHHPVCLSDVVLCWGDEGELCEAANSSQCLTGLTHGDILELKESLKAARQENDLQKVELKEKSMLIEDLKHHLDHALQKVEETRMDMEVCRVQANTYKSDFEEERRDRERAHETSESLREIVEEIQTELNDAKAQVMSYEKQVADLKKHSKKYQGSNESSRIRPFRFTAKRRQRTASENLAVDLRKVQHSLPVEMRVHPSVDKVVTPLEMADVQSLRDNQLPLIIDKECISDLFAVVNKLEGYKVENHHLKAHLTEVQQNVLLLAEIFDRLSQTSVIHEQQLIQKDLSLCLTNLIKLLSSTHCIAL